MIVEDGLSLVLLPIRVTGFDDQGFSAQLPETGYLVGKRRIRRNACRDSNATLTQNGFLAQGDLIDFSPLAFRVRLTPNPGTSFNWMNMNDSFTICLRKGEKIIFSGPCRCLRQTGDLRGRELVLAPLHQKIQRYRKQKLRTPRLRLTPTPSIHFEHPCFGKPNQRNILDLTFTGFSVEEQADDAVLMPGMVITDLEIRQDGMKGVTCITQVIYRRESAKGKVRCGLAILDMDFRAYRRLSHLMVHAGRSRKPVFPVRWRWMPFGNSYSTRASSTLKNTSSSNPRVKRSRTPTADSTKRIRRSRPTSPCRKMTGFTAMYPSCAPISGPGWSITLPQGLCMGSIPGFSFSRTSSNFLTACIAIPRSGFDHMIFYFRPENYFPNLFFGGFARDFGNPRACSLDLFAYMSHPTDRLGTPLPPGWQLEAFEPRHLPELERFYRNTSGGLLLDALRLGQTDEGCETVEEALSASRVISAMARLCTGPWTGAESCVDRQPFIPRVESIRTLQLHQGHRDRSGESSMAGPDRRPR